MNDLKKTLGKRIAKERKTKKLSQEMLAEIVGIHRTFMGKIERGEKNLTIEKLQQIAESLNISLERLFKGL